MLSAPWPSLLDSSLDPPSLLIPGALTVLGMCEMELCDSPEEVLAVGGHGRSRHKCEGLGRAILSIFAISILFLRLCLYYLSQLRLLQEHNRGWGLTSTRNLLLTVLEAEVQDRGTSMGRVLEEAFFVACKRLPSLRIHTRQRERERVLQSLFL